MRSLKTTSGGGVLPVADICRVPSDSLNSIKESCVCAFGIAVAVKGTEKAGRDMDKSIANRKRNTMAHRYSVLALPDPLPVLRFSVSVADLIVVPDRMVLSVLNHIQP